MDKKGFTLIELLIVVAIIGILAAIAIPNMISAMTRARQRRTMGDMRTIAIGWESRNVEVGRYNAAGAGYQGIDQAVDVTTLAGSLAPTYVKVVPTMDGWGRAFSCFTDVAWASTAAPYASKYVIISGGRDGVVDPAQGPGATTNFDCDIIYSNGQFQAYPEGVQQQ